MTDTDEIEYLRAFIKYIATDYIELSHEKIVVQRNDYIRGARKLTDKFEINSCKLKYLLL